MDSDHCLGIYGEVVVEPLVRRTLSCRKCKANAATPRNTQISSRYIICVHNVPEAMNTNPRTIQEVRCYDETSMHTPLPASMSRDMQHSRRGVHPHTLRRLAHFHIRYLKTATGEDEARHIAIDVSEVLNECSDMEGIGQDEVL
jgi:predicted transposase YbfD/YdcC